MNPKVKALQERIRAARGEIPARLVLKNARVVNVFTGGVDQKDVAVHNGFIAGLSSHYEGEEEVDLEGRWVVPGLIDGHIHMESTLLMPPELSKALLPHGTTTLVCDPHEIANVMGLEGLDRLMRESRGVALDFFFMAPSCVPATPLETSGHALHAADLATLKKKPRILGLAEMMNFPGVVAGEEEVLEKIVLFQDALLDGHAPALGGKDLQAYLAAGIRSDHEAIRGSEALEKLAGGMVIMIREGSTAKNLEALVPRITPLNARRFMFVSDDLHAEDIRKRGHLNFMFCKAVQMGLDPLTALRLVTLNPAEYFGFKDRGAVAPGFRADLIVLDHFETFRIVSVYKDGEKAVEAGESLPASCPPTEPLSTISRGLNVAPLTPEAFRLPHPGGKARVMEIVPGQIQTTERHESVPSENGFVAVDTERDILKLFVVERHRASGRIGLGLVNGFGLKQGVLASSIAHDAHNIIGVGVRDEDILTAVEALKRMGGGLIAVRDQKILSHLPLEFGGLMTRMPLPRVVRRLEHLKQTASAMGCPLSEPFMALSFLALPVIPHLKLTDRGLVDVDRFEIVPLFMEEAPEGGPHHAS